MNLFELFAKIGLDDKEYKKGVKGAEDTGNKMMGHLKKLGGTIAAAWSVKEVINFGKKCMEAAATAEQVEKKTDVIFGEMANTVRSWSAENERAFGLGAGTIQGFTNNIGDLVQGMGMGKEASVELAQGAVELGVKLGNWADIGADQVIDDMTKAMTGSHESVDKYGIKLNEAVLNQTAMNMGLGDTFNKLSESDKALVRYQAILDASGNAVKYWDDGNRSMAFSINETKEQFANITTSIGNLFLPMAAELTRKLADVMAHFAGLADDISKFVIEFGKNMNETGSISGAMSKYIQDHTGEMEEDVKLKYQAIANKFQFMWETIKGYWEGIGVPIIQGIMDMGKLLWDTLVTIWETVGVPMLEDMGAFWTEIFDTIQTVVDIFKEHWDEIMESMRKIFETFADVMKTVYETFIQPVFEAFTELIAYVRDNYADDIEEMIAWFNTFADDVKEIWEVYLKPAFDAIRAFLEDVLVPIFKWAFDNIIYPVVNNCFKGIKGLWENVLKPILKGVGDFLTGVFTGDWKRAFDGIVNIVKGCLGIVGEVVGGFVDIGKDIVKGIWNGITGMSSWIYGKVKGFFKGILDTAKNALGIKSPSRVFRDEVGKFMAQGVGVGFEEEMEEVNSDIENAIETSFDVSAPIPPVTNYSDMLAIMSSQLKSIADSGNTISIDGREVAKALSPYSRELNSHSLRNNPLVAY